MNGLREKTSIFELFLVFCLLLGLTTTVTGIQNKEMQFITRATISAPVSNTPISNASISNAFVSTASKPETEFPVVPVEVNDKNFDSMLKRYSPFVVNCWEIGCRPCKYINPTINEMALDFKGQIVFGKLCIDNNAASKKKFGITRTPTLLIFRNGTLVYRHVGNYPKPELEEMILTALKMR